MIMMYILCRVLFSPAWQKKIRGYLINTLVSRIVSDGVSFANPSVNVESKRVRG